jgi:hypothetical protein
MLSRFSRVMAGLVPAIHVCPLPIVPREGEGRGGEGKKDVDARDKTRA